MGEQLAGRRDGGAARSGGPHSEERHGDRAERGREVGGVVVIEPVPRVPILERPSPLARAPLRRRPAQRTEQRREEGRTERKQDLPAFLLGLTDRQRAGRSRFEEGRDELLAHSEHLGLDSRQVGGHEEPGVVG